MKKTNISYILLQGIFLVSVIFFALLVSSILFMFHISITQANLILAVLCSVLVTFYFSGYSIKKTAITTAVCLLIMAACMFVCMRVYDWSWDGNTYHKSMVGLLKNGWNPLLNSFFDYAAAHFPFINDVSPWYDAYPKGSEIWGACVYFFSKNIEAGKCFNLLSVIALFCICYALLNETNKLKKWQTFCCVFAAVLNPIIVVQCFTYYVDGLLGEILLLCFVSLVYLTFYKHGKYVTECWYLIFASINIGFNVKFSAIIFFAILCLTFFCYWLTEVVKENGLSKKTVQSMKWPFVLFAGSVASGLLITGATSYVINTIRYHNPLYVMIGANADNGIMENIPVAFRDIPKIESFFISLFSRCFNYRGAEHTTLKLPMTFNADEYYQAQCIDTRIGGWGLLFSGIFLISMLILLIYFVRKNRLVKRLNKLAITLLIVFFASVAVVPTLCWARFCIPVFWIPAGALIYIFLSLQSDKPKLYNMIFVAGMLVTLLFLNLLPALDKNYIVMKDYSLAHNQIERLSNIAKNEDNEIKICFSNIWDFYGRIFNLYDMGITNFEYLKYDETNFNDFSYRVFNDSYAVYCMITNLNGANSVTELFDFIEDRQNYILFIVAKDEASQSLTKETIQGFRKLGLAFELPDHYRWSYLAVLNDNELVYENLSDEAITYDVNIDNNNISLLSAGYDCGNTCSVKIDGVEYAVNGRGLNIVIYDKQNGYVIDSVCIDTFADNSLIR